MPKFESVIKIRVADISRHNRLKESTIFELLQEVACEHANNMGVGFKDLLPMNLAWAVAKIDLNIYAYPKARDIIKIETWASKRTRISTERDFIGYDSEGNVIFEARSLWILFSIEKRRFEMLSTLKEWKQIEDKRANADISKKLLKPTLPTHTKFYTPRKNDIDLNNHLNNAIYSLLAIDTLPRGFCESRIAKNISVSFLAEVKEEDIIESSCEIKASTTLHSMLKKDSNTEFARINITWGEL